MLSPKVNRSTKSTLDTTKVIKGTKKAKPGRNNDKANEILTDETIHKIDNTKEKT